MKPIISVVNQKGGVGKTTLVLLLASALARAGHPVLVVDADPQANATDVLCPDFDAEAYPTLYDVIDDPGAGLPEAIRATRWAGVSLLPGDIQLARTDSRRERGVEQRIRKALTGASFDGVPEQPVHAPLAPIVLIDCPRALGPLTDAALVASTHLLVVTEPTKDSLKGVRLVLDTAEAIREDYSPGLTLLGVLTNRVGRGSIRAMRADQVVEVFDHLAWLPALPEWVAITRVVEEGRPLDEQRGDPRAVQAGRIVESYASRLVAEVTRAGS